MKRIAVMTSGGDSPGMNAAVRAVVRTAVAHDVKVFGIRRAYEGILTGDFVELGTREVSGILNRGGTVLQTARNAEFYKPEGQQKGYAILQEKDVDGLVVIGGDGSMRGALALDKLGLPVIGVPGSIDNDIWGTNMSIGVDTALNTILYALDNLRDTASSHHRAFLVETMGRNCGYLALMGGILGGAELIIIPEKPVELEEIVTVIRKSYEQGKNHVLIINAEGSNHKTTRIAKYLESQGSQFEVRLTILGHLQRGGRPSAFDRLLATRMGVRAVELLLDGQQGQMVGLMGREIMTIPLVNACSQQRQANLAYYEMAQMLT